LNRKYYRFGVPPGKNDGQLYLKLSKTRVEKSNVSAPSILAAAFLSFPVVWILAFLISRKMGLDRNFAATLSSGVGVWNNGY
jgi:hypothetical protein